jgi:pyruvate kinase
VGDLVDRGVAGFVLSDETATGPHGPEAVSVLRQIADAAVAARGEADTGA